MASETYWMDRRVCVTGAAGFVGAHLCRRLVELGADVRGLDIVTHSPCWRAHDLLYKRVRLELSDLTHTANLRYHLGQDGYTSGLFDSGEAPQVIFHLAGVSHIAEAQAAPLGTWDTNVRAAWTLLEQCRRFTPVPPVVVLASSNHVYGTLRDPRPFVESDSLEQTDVYGTSKAMQDLVARAYARGWGLPVATLRHTNCFGPADPHASHIVTGTILSLLRGERPKLRGATIQQTGGAVKGYLYVSDVIDAYLRLAEWLGGGGAHDGPSVAYNAAPAAPLSVVSLVETVCQMAAPPELAPEYIGGPDEQAGYVEILDSARLRRLGWRPEVSLQDGLRRTWDWYRAQGGMLWAAA